MNDSFAAAIADLNDIAARFEGAGERLERLTPLIVKKTGADIEAVSKQLVPVDTGATKNSIGGVEDTTITGSGDGFTVETIIGPQTDYADLLETGTERMAPRPYMAPAADAAEPGFFAAFEQAVDPLSGPA